jgi:ADP-ribose pyrophosphatase YjhB (NUDIX family)
MKIILTRKSKSALLLEGRKDNALAIIGKKVQDPELLKYFQEDIFKFLYDADVSPNKKYIEWAARRIQEIIQKEMRSEEHEKLYANFLGGRKSFPKEYDEKMLDLIRGYSRSERYETGHLTNEEIYDRAAEAIRQNVWNRANVIARSLPTYHRLAERNLIDKNIDSFKEIFEWEHSIYKANQDERERDEMKKREAGAKETTDYVHDDDDVMMVRPNSEDASCYYGRGTTWCISATQSRNWFDEYSGKGAAFYFVLFKHLPQDDTSKKLALVYMPGDESPSEVFDVPDDEVGVDAITEAANMNVLAKGAKVAISSQLKQIKGTARNDAFKSFFETVVEQYQGAVAGEYDDEEGDRGAKIPKELKMTLASLGLVDDLTDDDWQLVVSNDIYEFIGEQAAEQESFIMGYSSDHLAENPGGPSDADYDAKLAEHNFTHVYVSHEDLDYEGGTRYWDGGASISMTDIDDDLEDVDEDEFENVFRGILDDYNIYPDDVEMYGGDMSIRFNPDHDENEGLNGFENFLNRMSEYDDAFEKMFGEDEEAIRITFLEAGLLVGTTMTTLHDYFDNLELDNFSIDIEDRELSIYKQLDITVPIPSHLFRGLTDDALSWTEQNRAKIEKSPALQALDRMIKDNTSDHSDQLIDQIRSVFDRLFEIYLEQLTSALPGFEQEAQTQMEQGLLIPDYNVSLYRTSDVTAIGSSGLLISYFFDVRIEADEKEHSSPENLKLIELFLKRVDNQDMLDKIRERLETIVQNDVVKNIIPQFKEGGEEPELDTMHDEITSKSERESEEHKAKRLAQEKAVAELDRIAFGGRRDGESLQENKRTIKVKVRRGLLSEAAPYGGYSPGFIGGGGQAGTTIMPHKPSDPGYLGDDTGTTAKVVLHRNSKVLLIKNFKGWDLPGGHIKQSENVMTGLIREIFEETGLSLAQQDIISLNRNHSNHVFFCAEFPHDDIRLSDEHFEFGFFTLEEVMQLEDISEVYRNIIKKCMNPNAADVDGRRSQQPYKGISSMIKIKINAGDPGKMISKDLYENHG